MSDGIGGAVVWLGVVEWSGVGKWRAWSLLGIPGLVNKPRGEMGRT